MWNIMKKTWKWFMTIFVILYLLLMLHWMTVGLYTKDVACYDNGDKEIKQYLSDRNITIDTCGNFCRFSTDYYKIAGISKENLDILKEAFEFSKKYFQGDFEIEIFENFISYEEYINSPTYNNLSGFDCSDIFINQIATIKYKHKTQKLEIIQKGEYNGKH